jgi:predicted ABC-type ATPase
MAGRPPLVVVIAGPNGAGKTTIAPRLLRDALAVSEFVNADPIATGLSAFRPESVAMAAGRVMLARLKALATAREDFAFETTLASRSFAPWLRSLRASGYRLTPGWLGFRNLRPPPLSGRPAPRAGFRSWTGARMTHYRRTRSARTLSLDRR